MISPLFKNAVIACIFAGFTAFLLSLTAFVGLPFAFAIFLRPLPIFLVGLKYGSLATFLAGTITVILIQLFFPFPQGLIAFFVLAFPAFALIQITSRALIINRLEPRFEPIGLIVLFTGILAVIIAISSILFLFGFDYAAYASSIKTAFSKALVTFTLDNEAKELTSVLIEASPIIMPSIGVMLWIMAMLGNLFLATKLAPKFAMKMPDVNLQHLRLPFLSVLLMGIGFGMTYADGLVRITGFIIIVSLIIPFILQGLAVIHFKTNGKTWRKGFLAVFYFTAVLIGWPWLFAFLIGLADPAFIFRKTNGA